MKKRTLALFVEVNFVFEYFERTFQAIRRKEGPQQKQAEFQTRIKQRVFPGCGREGEGMRDDEKVLRKKKIILFG